MESICRFIPTGTVPDVIHTVNFVYETELRSLPEPRLSSVYRIQLVISGTAVVGCGTVKRQVHEGDVFFIFPAVSYTIEGDDDFTYMYISFFGVRAAAVTERLGINRYHFVFEGFPELCTFWKSAIGLDERMMDLTSESVLLYTLSVIGSRAGTENDVQLFEGGERFAQIKKYVDDSFTDPGLSLEALSERFSYHKKYISQMFCRYLKVGIREYVNMLRINHACVLIDQGYTGVGDIAFLCGFNDPMYFSKVFRSRMGQSPKSYIARRRQKKQL